MPGRKPPQSRVVIRIPGHPLASLSGHVFRSRAILYDKLGSGWHPCHWCGVPLRWRRGHPRKRDISADHLDSNVRNDEPDNLVPSCMACNAGRANPRRIPGGMPWIEFHYGDSIIRSRAEPATCETCGQRFMRRISERKQGRARFCSLACAGQPPIQPGELVIRSSTTHSRVTRAEQRHCLVCHQPFLHMIANRDPKKGRFCSRSCANRGRYVFSI